VLVSDFTALNRNGWVENVGVDGSKYYSIHYELVVSVKATGMTFSTKYQGTVPSIEDVSQG
jgi:hypothetical protein